MQSQTIQTEVWSEDGDGRYPNQLMIALDGTQPTCPITLYRREKEDGKPVVWLPVFSMGEDEIEEFIKALEGLRP